MLNEHSSSRMIEAVNARVSDGMCGSVSVLIRWPGLAAVPPCVRCSGESDTN